MDFIKGLLIISTVLVSNSASYEMAKLWSTPIAITSSTLAWSSVQPGNSVPPNAVAVGSGGPFWCRTRNHAVWVSGAVVDGLCRVPFFGEVHVSDDFQVLVSLNGSSRLVNVPWDSLEVFPPSPVATPQMLLAFSPDAEGGAVLPGFVVPRERRAHFLKGGESIELENAHLVTEKEPVQYRLEDVKLSDKTERLRHRELLLEFTLINEGNTPSDKSREVFFVSAYRVYFGRMKGTVMGLNTTVSGPDIFPVNITWGVKNDFSKNLSHIINYRLPPKTSVKVHLIAVIRNLEGNYQGKLTSIYDDGFERQRNVEGPHMERRLAELRAEFAQVEPLDGEEPTEELPLPKPVILLHSTTTTPAPTANGGGLVASPSGNQYLPRPQEVGVNGAVVYSSLWPLVLPLGLLWRAFPYSP